MKKDNIEKAKGIKTNELNTYLLKKYHCDTYTCLIRDNKKEHVFQPLELFHLAESVANYIVENKHTPPIHLQEYISKIVTDKKFTAKQTYYYVSCLHDILTEKHSWQSCSTESLQTSSWQSDEIRYWLLDVISDYKEKAYPEKIKKEQIIVFSNLQKEAKEIQNSHERIKFWLEHIAEYKQFGRINLYQPEGNIKIPFDKKCELEIETEKALAALETTPAQTETKQKSKIQFTPKHFNVLFNNPALVNDCLTLLKETDNPCINDENGYVRNKGAFVVWFNALEIKNMFNCSFSNDKERAAILNHNFHSLNISGSLFRQSNKRATNSYKSYFENEIAIIKTLT